MATKTIGERVKEARRKVAVTSTNSPVMQHVTARLELSELVDSPEYRAEVERLMKDLTERVHRRTDTVTDNPLGHKWEELTERVDDAPRRVARIHLRAGSEGERRRRTMTGSARRTMQPIYVKDKECTSGKK